MMELDSEFCSRRNWYPHNVIESVAYAIYEHTGITDADANWRTAIAVLDAVSRVYQAMYSFLYEREDVP
jgi:hypothetical protein